MFTRISTAIDVRKVGFLLPELPAGFARACGELISPHYRPFGWAGNVQCGSGHAPARRIVWGSVIGTGACAADAVWTWRERTRVGGGSASMSSASGPIHVPLVGTICVPQHLPRHLAVRCLPSGLGQPSVRSISLRNRARRFLKSFHLETWPPPSYGMGVRIPGMIPRHRGLCTMMDRGVVRWWESCTETAASRGLLDCSH